MLRALLCVVLFFSVMAAQTAPAGARAEVLQAEAAFDAAKVHNDVAALDRILANDFFEINQWGARRTKPEMLQLFRDFKTTSLAPADVNIRVSGPVAILDGTMLESHDVRRKFTFVRTWVKEGEQWRLLVSVQAFAVDPSTMKAIDPPVSIQQPRREVTGGV